MMRGMGERSVLDDARLSWCQAWEGARVSAPSRKKKKWRRAAVIGLPSGTRNHGSLPKLPGQNGANRRNAVLM